MREKEIIELSRRAQLADLAEKSANIGVWEWDIVNESLYWSDQVFQIFDIDKEKFGASYDYFLSRVHIEDRDKVSDAVNLSLSDPSIPYQVTHRVQHLNGNIHWVLETGKVYASDDGKTPVKMIGVVQVIDTVKNIEKENKKLSDEIIKKQKALDAVAIFSETDIKGTITFINENFSEISGYAKEDIIGKKHNVLNSGFHSQAFWKDLWEKITTGKIWRGEICNKSKDGTLFWEEATIFPLFDDENVIYGFQSVSVDITEQKIVESQLNHSAKLASIGELAAGVGHEINNPLSIIMGMTNLCQTYLRQLNLEDDKILSHLQDVQNASKRIQNIVKGLRTYAKVDIDDMTSIRVNSVINDVVSFLKDIYNKEGFYIQTELEDNLYINGSYGKLQQILINLIANAKDACIQQKKSICNIKLKSEKQYVVIQVIDEGTGIPNEIRDQIFNPFFTTKDVGKGTGLGLGIVSKLVETFAGTIDFESTIGKGTTFTLKFPAIPKP